MSKVERVLIWGTLLLLVAVMVARSFTQPSTVIAEAPKSPLEVLSETADIASNVSARAFGNVIAIKVSNVTAAKPFEKDWMRDLQAWKRTEATVRALIDAELERIKRLKRK